MFEALVSSLKWDTYLKVLLADQGVPIITDGGHSPAATVVEEEIEHLRAYSQSFAGQTVLINSGTLVLTEQGQLECRTSKFT